MVQSAQTTAKGIPFLREVSQTENRTLSIRSRLSPTCFVCRPGRLRKCLGGDARSEEVEKRSEQQTKRRILGLLSFPSSSKEQLGKLWFTLPRRLCPICPVEKGSAGGAHGVTGWRAKKRVWEGHGRILERKKCKHQLLWRFFGLGAPRTVSRLPTTKTGPSGTGSAEGWHGRSFRRASTC
eukprot:scaffold2484_cov261-Pinguiococcus_pyrenoidosus.AAC.4